MVGLGGFGCGAKATGGVSRAAWRAQRNLGMPRRRELAAVECNWALSLTFMVDEVTALKTRTGSRRAKVKAI